MKNTQFERSIDLLGIDKFNLLQSKNVLVVGLGGVGGTALEALIRSGIKHVIIMDFDVVDSSNLNRQILYTSNDVGKKKVVIAKKHILNINSDLEITLIDQKVDEKIGEKLDKYQIDYIVDAIDDVKGKVYLIKYAEEKNVPIIVSLGMANRLNPTLLSIKSLDRTTHDPLAKKLRYEMKKAGLNTKNVNVVISKEIPGKFGTKLNSMMMVPSASGLTIAYWVINSIMGEK